MPDNLSVTISADSSKLEVAAQRAKAALSEVSKEMTRLRNEAAKTGDWSGVEALAPKLAAARAQLRTTTAATKDLGVAAADTSLGLAEMGKMLGGVARAAGIAIPGIKGLRFGLISLVGVEIIRGINAITEQITKLSDLSKKTGLDPTTIKQFGDAIAQTGGKAEDAAGMLEKLVAPFSAEKKQEMVSWWGAANDAARDGRPLASDYAKALNELHINMQQFGTDAKGQRDLVIAVSKALADLAKSGKIDDANRLSVELFGKNWREAGDAVLRFIQISATGQTATGPATPEAIEAAKNYAIAINGLTTAWNDLLATLATSGIFRDIVHFVNDLSQGIKDSEAQIQSLIDWIDNLIATTEELLRTLGLIGANTSIRNTDAGGGGDIGGFASGGYIRGRGTGTSDSILARLSNGEFVVRARAVDHWGPRFLHALNNLQNPFGHYATGGLVRTTPRFASGGMVTARTGDGMTVNLHFPGGNFQLHGDKAIVAGLTREARRAGMLSAGRMPGALA